MSNRALTEETKAAANLIMQLRALGAADDERAVHDTIEGETSFFEALSEAVKREGEDSAALKALKEYKVEIGNRIGRIKGRVEATRAAIAVAMSTLGKRTERTPFGTVTLTNLAPKVIITEEADIPVKFIVSPPPVQPDPYVDEKALKAALEAGERVAGAHLSNGGISVGIRRK
jgi:hypothetical protein